MSGCIKANQKQRVWIYRNDLKFGTSTLGDYTRSLELEIKNILTRMLEKIIDTSNYNCFLTAKNIL